MSVTNGYVDEDSVVRALSVQTGNYDEDIRDAIESGAREIDGHCGRSFYADTVATARVFYPDDWLNVRIDDALEIVSVKTDTNGDGSYGQTLAVSDYQTAPLNGVMNGLTGWPVIALHAVGSNRFPVYNRRPGVQVVAKWGWAAVPRPVRQANLILAEALVKQLEAPGGIAGTGEFGAIRVVNNELNLVRAKLLPYCRLDGTGAGSFA